MAGPTGSERTQALCEMAELHYDVCVVGGGPAGAVAAFHLANFGYRVCLVEREVFPRPHVGEALSPGILPLLESIGLGRVLTRACLCASRETLICWKKSRPERISSDIKTGGFLVDRGEFDLTVLRLARDAGVFITQPAHARVRREAAGWRVETQAPQTPTISARFVVDAAGRAGSLPGRRIPFGPKTFALWAHVEIPSGSATRIEAVPEGWFWAAPLSQRQVGLMLFCDRRFLRQGGRDLEAALRETLAGTKLLSECARAAFLGPIQVRDATCAYASEIIGLDFVKIGEASFSLDPLSSTGVEKAIQTALVGAIVINTLAHHPERAGLCRKFYQERQQETVCRHAVWTSRYYREVVRHAKHPFWATRRTVSELSGPTAPKRSEPIAAPHPATRMRLAQDASLVEESCIVNETIDTRRGIRSPALPRPVVFLDGIEIAPLLAGLRGRPTWMELISQWSEGVPVAKAERLALWFWENRVFCAAPAA